MNILIKLTSIVSLIIAPHIAVTDGHATQHSKPQIEAAATQASLSNTGASATTSSTDVVLDDYNKEEMVKLMFNKEPQLNEEHRSWLDGMAAKMKKDENVKLVFEVTTNQPLQFDPKVREQRLKEYFETKGVSKDRIGLSVVKSGVDQGMVVVEDVVVRITQI